MADHIARFQRSTNTQTAGWFLDLFSAGRLDLDPPYQRRSVWNLVFKQYFIDSLIRNYPAPTIFLQVEYSPDRPAIYHVIDGKQRLSALFEFYKDEFSTPESLADINLSDKYYSELPEEIRLALLEYIFSVESVKNASTAELNEAFDRLNRNIARLNKQELRNAKYGGAFIQKVNALSEHPFWTEIGLVTPTRIRRMLDVEQVSELYVISMDGTQDGKDYLDNYYSENDQEIEGEEEADRKFIQVQDFLRELSNHFPLKSSRFVNVADFYSLWAALTGMVEDGGIPPATKVAERLHEFAREIDSQEARRAVSYRLAAVQGSNKKPNRDFRATTLRQVMEGES